MAQTPPSNHIASTSLQEYFVDENTGLPLAGGAAFFYQDTNRVNQKLVWQLTGDPDSVGGYEFKELPNPVQLSATGTFMDDNGNNIVVYYYPYDEEGNLDLYYVVVKNHFGVPEFTRSAWPPIAVDIADENDNNPTFANQVSNSQFVDTLFSPAESATYTYAAGLTTTQIAPDWALEVSATGAATVTVTRTAIAGGPPLSTNPPYTLTVTGGANIAIGGLRLRQRLQGNPGIWSKIGAVDNGYVAGCILVFPGSTLRMEYRPSIGAATTILDVNNAGGASVLYNATVQLPASTNTDTPPAGYVDIVLYLAEGGATRFSSIQVVGLSTNKSDVPYLQEPVNRQEDHLFHYYNPLLSYKPISSYLVGWDFPLNPANVTGLPASGTPYAPVNPANPALGSEYTWDQTIFWSTIAGSSMSYQRGTDGSYVITAGANSQFATIQYLDGFTVNDMLSGPLSVNVAAKTDQPAGIDMTVSLWYSTGTALPSIAPGSYQSIVATLNANGSVATFNQPTPGGNNWIEVKRSLNGDVPFTTSLAFSADGSYTTIGAGGYQASDLNGAMNGANFFAIVVGFGVLNTTQKVQLKAVSVVPGAIPTLPAPQTQDEVIRECQHYMWRTYLPTDTAGVPSPAGALFFPGTQAVLPGTINGTTAADFLIRYPVAMRVEPNITLYSPHLPPPPAPQVPPVLPGFIGMYEGPLTGGGGGVAVYVRDIATTNWNNGGTIGYKTKHQAYFSVAANLPVITQYIFSQTIKQIIMGMHAVVDARLGIV